MRDGLRRGGAGTGDGRPAVPTDGDHQRFPAPGRWVAGDSRPGPVAGDPRDSSAPPALAQPPSELAKRAAPLRRHSALLLPGRSGRGRNLADRSRAGTRQRGPPIPRSSRGRQRAGEPRPLTAGAQARDRRRQDHRHGHAHRVADRQCGAPSRQPAVHARIPGGHPGSHHPRSSEGAPAERPGQLLPEPRAGAGRHARRPGPRQDRHHQLPRLHAARDSRHLDRREAAPSSRAGVRTSRPARLRARCSSG